MNTRDEIVLRNAQGHIPEDEIDLVRLWLILWKRKYLIGGFFFLCLLGGAAFAFLMPAQYIYTTSIEIGTILDNNGQGIVVRAIELPQAVLAKVETSYVPLAVSTMASVNDDELLEIKVKNPKDSNLIVLTSNGALDKAGTYLELHGLVTQPLLEDHRRIIDVPRHGYQNQSRQEKIKLKNLQDPRIYIVAEKDLLIQIDSAKTRLTELDDQKILSHSQNKRLTETQNLLRLQISKVEANLVQAYGSRPKATSEVDDGAQAMTMLMITNQIEQNEKRLADLSERLNIGLENQKEVLQNDISENRRAWDLQKEKIAELESQLVKLKVNHESEQESQKNVVSSVENKIEDLPETRTLGVAVRSIKPSGPGKKIILALSGILGLMGGVSLAFFAELIRFTRQKMATGN